MKRRLFNALSIASLVLCAATVALWARSEYVMDYRGGSRANRAIWIYSGGGGVCIAYAKVPQATGSFCPAMELDGRTPQLKAPRITNEPIPDIGSWLSLPGSSFFRPLWSSSFRFTGVAGCRQCLALRDFSMGPVAFVPTGTQPSQLTMTTLVLPYWVPCCLLALLPMLQIMRRLHGNRRSLGLCGHCGYDLRATPDRCPECGAISKKPVEAARSSSN
jgi:hypothetical protein